MTVSRSGATLTRCGGTAQSSEDQRAGVAVSDAMPRSDLRLRSLDILGQFGTLNESLVRLDGEENRGTPAVLRQYQWALGDLHLFDKGRHTGTEF